MIVYNVIRLKMIQAGERYNKCPLHLSFTAAKQILSTIRTLGESDETTVLEFIASQEIGNRTGRYEPRAVKDNPRPYKTLDTSRDEARSKFYKKSKK